MGKLAIGWFYAGQPRLFTGVSASQPLSSSQPCSFCCSLLCTWCSRESETVRIVSCWNCWNTWHI